MIYKDNNFIHEDIGKVAIIKSARRKKVALVINHQNDSVEIRMPQITMSKSEIEKIIKPYIKWIKEEKEKFLNGSSNILQRQFKIGENFYYLGELYPLKSEQYSIFDGKNFLVSSHSPELIKLELKYIYKNLCRNYLKFRVPILAEKFNIEFKSIKINSASTRWGSCSSKGNLNFPWNLIMCPLEVVDYVIIHELAHCLEMNHSKKFWFNVEKMLPNYKKHLKFLKEKGYLFTGF